MAGAKLADLDNTNRSLNFRHNEGLRQLQLLAAAHRGLVSLHFEAGQYRSGGESGFDLQSTPIRALLPAAADVSTLDDSIRVGGGCIAMDNTVAAMRGFSLSRCTAGGLGGSILATGASSQLEMAAPFSFEEAVAGLKVLPPGITAVDATVQLLSPDAIANIGAGSNSSTGLLAAPSDSWSLSRTSSGGTENLDTALATPGDLAREVPLNALSMDFGARTSRVELSSLTGEISQASVASAGGAHIAGYRLGSLATVQCTADPILQALAMIARTFDREFHSAIPRGYATPDAGSLLAVPCIWPTTLLAELSSVAARAAAGLVDSR